MLKTIRDMIIGAVCAGAVSAALAVVGTPPLPNGQEALINQAWLNGLAGGLNFSYQSGLTAHAGGTQAACFNLQPGFYLYELDTVATTNDSVCLPFALAGENLSIRNAGAQTVALYAQSGTNGATSSTDTINGASNSSSYTVAANNNVECFVAKSGNWSCVKGN